MPFGAVLSVIGATVAREQSAAHKRSPACVVPVGPPFAFIWRLGLARDGDAQLYLVGIDPGLAMVGMALVHHNGTRHLMGVDLIETDREAASRKIAVSADDNRRFHEIHSRVVAFLQQVPSGEKALIAMEGFAYMPGAGRNLLKTAQAVGVIKGAVYAAGKIPWEFQPGEIKRVLLGAKSGSKQQVHTVLKDRYPTLEEKLKPYAKGKWEHITDALALTECAFEEYAQRRLYLAGIEH
jgi:Holliday junction resolvasome RuvABC endonuclease subunit